MLVLISLGPLRLVSKSLISRVRPEEAELAIALAPGGDGARVLERITELGGHVTTVDFGDERDAGRRPARVGPDGVRPRRRGGLEARRRRARAVAALTRPRKALLASGNPHKLEELRAALPGWELELLGVGGFPPETADTYYENAAGKARFGRAVGDPDAWILGEDSGIEVDALGGGPGTASARWADDGVERLLEELAGVVRTAVPATSASWSSSPRRARSGAGPGF